MTLFGDILLHFGQRWLATAAMLLPLAACAPSLNWRDVQPADAQGLQLMFPCHPDTQTRQVHVPGMGGAPVQMHILSCEAEGVVWALSYFDTGTPQRWRVALEAWQQALLGNLRVTAGLPGAGAGMQQPGIRQSVAAMHVPGATDHPDASTWWAAGWRPVNQQESEPVGIKTWHFAKGLQVFQASVQATALRPDDPRWATFAGSIHFRQ